MSGSIIGAPFRTVKGSFSLKLLLLFSLVIVLIAGIGGVIYVQTGEALQTSTEDDMERSTVLQANTLEEWVDRSEESVEYAAEAAPVRSGDDAAIRDHLSERAENAPTGVVAYHYVSTDDATVRVSSNGDAEGTGYGEVAWHDAIASDASETTVTNPYEDPTTGAASLAFVRAVPDSDAVVVMVVDLTELSESLEQPSSSDASFTHVVNSEGTVVASHHTEDINQQNMAAHDGGHGDGHDDGHDGESAGVQSMGVERGLQGETGYVEMEMHGQTMSMGYAPVEGTDWVLMTHVPTDEAFALQDDITQSVIGLVVASLLGLGLIGAVVGRNTTRPLRELSETAQEIESGNLDVELSSDRTDEIGQLFDAFDGMRVSLKESLEEAERERQRAETQRQELADLAGHLERKADELGDVTAAAADGDLTRQMDEASQNEAMERIAREYNDLIAEMNGTVTDLQRFAEEVAAHGEEVTASAEEVRSASEQVTESVQAISERTERQHERFQTVTGRMGEMSATSEEIASLCDQVSTIAARTAQTGSDGRTAAQEAIDAMESLDDDAESAVEAIVELNDQMDRVEEIAESITAIAKETNMLALNANIEATRSVTDDDAGFGVVADEVKDMADDTRESAEEIEAILEEFRQKTERAVDEVQSTRSEIDSRTETVEDTAAALDRIADYAEETNNGVQEITTAAQQQAASVEEVLAMVEETAELSEEVNDEAGTVAAAAEEQTSALTEVTDNAENLAGQARRLREQLDGFETDGTQESVAAADD